MQFIVGKRGEFENSYTLLYILLKSCLCCCSLATLAPQQLRVVHTFRFNFKNDSLCACVCPWCEHFLLMVELISQMGTRLYRPSKDTFFGQ